VEDARSAARTPTRCAPIEDLLSLARDEGLGSREGALRDLAIRSWRMVPDARRRARAWAWTGDELALDDERGALVAQVDLTAVRRLSAGISTTGWLAVFIDPPTTREGEESPRRGRGVLLDTAGSQRPEMTPMALKPEMVLPRVWHASVQALDFSEAEQDAYTRVRRQLQNLQGVEQDDDGGGAVAYHRLFGYPNEKVGAMPGECARLMEGEGVDAPEAAWRLLLQLSVGGSKRLYLWFDRRLETVGFADLIAFIR
jgi:hypothetical protein